MDAGHVLSSSSLYGETTDNRRFYNSHVHCDVPCALHMLVTISVSVILPRSNPFFSHNSSKLLLSVPGIQR